MGRAATSGEQGEGVTVSHAEPSGYTRRDAEIARGVFAVRGEAALLASCKALAPDFLIANETEKGIAMIVARWTVRGVKCGFKVEATPRKSTKTVSYGDQPREELLAACLGAILRRVRP